MSSTWWAVITVIVLLIIAILLGVFDAGEVKGIMNSYTA